MTVKELRKLLKKFNKSAVVLITDKNNKDYYEFIVGYSFNGNHIKNSPKKCDEVYLDVNN